MALHHVSLEGHAEQCGVQRGQERERSGLFLRSTSLARRDITPFAPSLVREARHEEQMNGYLNSLTTPTLVDVVVDYYYASTVSTICTVLSTRLGSPKALLSITFGLLEMWATHGDHASPHYCSSCISPLRARARPC